MRASKHLRTLKIVRDIRAFLSLHIGYSGREKQELKQLQKHVKRKTRRIEQLQRQVKRKTRRIERMQELLSNQAHKLSNTDHDLKVLRQQLTNKDRELVEVQNQMRGGLPIPPPHEISLVAGTEDAGWFLRSGEMHTRHIREILEENGLEIERFDSILEFGCGCGRLIRHWNTSEGPPIHGTDYNPKLIA